MHIEVDTHTHTVLSGHAHSTLLENAAAAKNIGLKAFVLSDHGPSIPGAPPDFNIGTYPYLPSHMEGVRVYPGVEANIIDHNGSIDIRMPYLEYTEFAIAGMHEVVIKPAGRAKDTQATIDALGHKYIDIIAHPDNPSYDFDYEAIVKEAARHNKLLEVNNHSFEYRKGGIENAYVYLPLCVRYGVRVCVSSDAHSTFGMGHHSTALRVLQEINFPSELIVNLTMERFEGYLQERKIRVGT